MPGPIDLSAIKLRRTGNPGASTLRGADDTDSSSPVTTGGLAIKKYDGV